MDTTNTKAVSMLPGMASNTACVKLNNSEEHRQTQVEMRFRTEMRLHAEELQLKVSLAQQRVAALKSEGDTLRMQAELLQVKADELQILGITIQARVLKEEADSLRMNVKMLPFQIEQATWEIEKLELKLAAAHLCKVALGVYFGRCSAWGCNNWRPTDPESRITSGYCGLVSAGNKHE